MTRLLAPIALSLFVAGCVVADHRHAYPSACTAPAVGLCAGCQISCRADDDEARCIPGDSTPPQGTVAGYCSEEATCACH